MKLIAEIKTNRIGYATAKGGKIGAIGKAQGKDMLPVYEIKGDEFIGKGYILAKKKDGPKGA